MLTVINTEAEMEAYVAQFRTPDLGDKIKAAAAKAEPGADVRAAIVSVGCDVPPGVEVEEGEAGYLVSPLKVSNPLPECLAAVTTVAVVAVLLRLPLPDAVSRGACGRAPRRRWRPSAGSRRRGS